MRLLSSLLLWLCLLILALACAVAVAIGLALDSQPSVERSITLSVQDISRARQLQQWHDPRRLVDGDTRELQLSRRDVELLADGIIQRLPHGRQTLRSTAYLEPDQADLLVAIELPISRVGSWLNVQAVLVPDPADTSLRLKTLKLGRLPIPGNWALAAWDKLAPKLQARYPDNQALRLVQALLDGASMIERARLQHDQLNLTLTWDTQLASNIWQQGKALHFSGAELIRVKHYGRWLADLMQGLGAGDHSLATILPPYMKYVRQRIADDGQAALEQRTAILALALRLGLEDRYNAQVLGQPEARQLPPLGKARAVLHQRADLAQHYLVSAALTITAGSPFADVIGVWKEVDDAKGKGFSFADLLADRCGVRFAEQAVVDPGGWALRISQVRLEHELMPPIAGLPEGLRTPEFAKLYRNRDNAAWQQAQAELAGRVEQVALLASGIRR